MTEKSWNDVFASYPDVDTLYIVEGQPFIERKLAANHSRTTGKGIIEVKRPQAKPAKEAPAQDDGKKQSTKSKK